MSLRHRRRLADLVIDVVAGAGCGVAFGMPGDSVNGLLDAIRAHPHLRWVGARNETAAALMAIGYAHAAGGLGFCLGTNGPGATHLVAGLGAASCTPAPVLAVSGTSPVAELGTRSFQETVPADLFAGVSDGRTVQHVSQWRVVPSAVSWALTNNRPVHVAATPNALIGSLPAGAGHEVLGGRRRVAPLRSKACEHRSVSGLDRRAAGWSVAAGGALRNGLRRGGCLVASSDLVDHLEPGLESGRLVPVCRRDGSALATAIGVACAGRARVIGLLTDADARFAAEVLTAQAAGLDLVCIDATDQGLDVVHAVAVGSGMSVVHASTAAELSDLLAVDAIGPRLVRLEPATGIVPVARPARSSGTVVYQSPSIDPDVVFGETPVSATVLGSAEGAFMAASGAAKASDGVAVVAVRGNELLSGINGLLDASYDSASVVIVVDGDPEPADCGLVASAIDATIVETDDAVQLALHRSNQPGHGLRAILPADLVRHLAAAVALVREHLDRSRDEHGTVDIPRQVVERLRRAEAVTLLVGAGCRRAPDPVARLVDHLGAAVVTTMGALGAGFDTLAGYAGRFGASGHRAAAAAVRDADVLVRLGCSDRGQPFGQPVAPTVLTVTLDPAVVGPRAADAHTILADASAFADALTDAIGDEGRARRLVFSGRAAKRFHTETERRGRSGSGRRPVSPSAAAARIARATVAVDGQATVDVGLVTLWAFRAGAVLDRVMFARSFASMGFAVPAALGAVVTSARPTVALVGDGGFLISLSELQALDAAEVPVAVTVFNNGRLGAIKFEMESMGWAPHGDVLPVLDIPATCRSLGIQVSPVVSLTELDRAMEAALARPGLTVIDVAVDPLEIPAPPVLSPRMAIGYATAVAGQLRRDRVAYLRDRRWLTPELRYMTRKVRGRL
jgi:thiamine pyrophosphate-dependent acetolactate synthase large subunit-like protein